MQQLRSGIFPPRPIYPPVISNVTERTPPRQKDNKPQQHTPHRQANIGKTRDDSIEGKGTAKPVLNVAASPFIPLQVCGDSNNRYPHLLIPRNIEKFYSLKVDCNTTIRISCNIFAVFLLKVATSNVKFCKTCSRLSNDLAGRRRGPILRWRNELLCVAALIRMEFWKFLIKRLRSSVVNDSWLYCYSSVSMVKEYKRPKQIGEIKHRQLVAQYRPLARLSIGLKCKRSRVQNPDWTNTYGFKSDWVFKWLKRKEKVLLL